MHAVLRHVDYLVYSLHNVNLFSATIHHTWKAIIADPLILLS